MTKTLAGIRANLIVTVVLLLLAPCTAIYADTIRLRNVEEDVEAGIVELTNDYIGVSFAKKDIKAVTFLPGDKQTSTDLVTLHKGGVKLKCKVASVDSDNVVIWIPKSEVVSVHMVFPQKTSRGKGQALQPPSYSPPSRPQAPAAPARGLPRDSWADRRTVEPPLSREAAKERMKMEVMRELETEQMVEEEAWQSPEALKDEIKRELKREFEAQRESDEKVFQETQLGRVEGRMLRKGLPLTDCQIKIIMLVKRKIPFTNSFFQPNLPTEYEGITDADGRYHLLNVAPGEYKIYWMPRGETGWIRRLEMKPDVIVESGKTTYPKDIETFKRILN